MKNSFNEFLDENFGFKNWKIKKLLGLTNLNLIMPNLDSFTLIQYLKLIN